MHRIGRTARIGHQGLATSFYNDRNEDIAQDLVNVLVECDCSVPDFLSHLVPEEGATLQFDDDTDDEAEDGDAAVADNDGGAPVGGAWGAAAAEDVAPAANAWGAAPAENGDASFTADGGAGASAW